LPSANPNVRNWLAKTPAVGPADWMSELAEPIAERPNVDIDADEPAPEARLVPEVSAVDDDVRVVNSDSCDVDDEDDIDEAAEASPGSASVSGVDNAKPSGVDITVVNGATVCALVPAEVVTAWTTAAAWAANPAGLVVCAGVVNALSTDAACAAA
jgi:hypothetical protein